MLEATRINSNDENMRKHFRLTYPPQERPVFTMKSGHKFKIQDCSEGGLCIITQDNFPWKQVSGDLCFNRRHKIKVRGRLIRREGNLVIIKLMNHIDYSVIMAEQRFLLQNYKEFLRASS